ncbi:hypothetical protein F5148DRAFT_1271939 [Russula earlei]|uniref:Uncharacterized protein n=1 Tax=Russula earlei TaxID=71964 RepID=A0ACC0TR60_9AGAM|nr:hypothetical protein F5148DRAFT_1271939 [Russula earlei]
MHYVVMEELLRRSSIRDGISESPYFIGIICGFAIWVAYAWVTRLRSEALTNPALHAAFLFFLVLFKLALLHTIFSDPGICQPLARDALRLTIEDLVRSNRLTRATFCLHCLVVKPPYTEHCSDCSKCVTYREFSVRHYPWMLNCIGVKNHTIFILFMVSIAAGVLIFDYLVWIHLHSLKHVPLPTPACVLPYAICRLTSADMFLFSIAAWSTLIHMVVVVVLILYAVDTCKTLMRRLWNVVDSVVVQGFYQIFF